MYIRCNLFVVFNDWARLGHIDPYKSIQLIVDSVEFIGRLEAPV